MSERLSRFLDRLAGSRVVVVGDLILDEYLCGNVRRISPEAPVPVLESSRIERVPGGAANVANNLAALGCETAVLGAVGDDDQGQALIRLLVTAGVDVAGVVSVPGRPTTHKLRVVAQGQHVLRIDREQSGALPPHAREVLCDRFEAACDGAAGVICSDYRKGVLDDSLLRGMMARARRHGLPVIVDPKGTNYQRYAGASVLTPNLQELAVAVGRELGGTGERDAAAAALRRSADVASLLVTCGREGMVVYGDNAHPVSIPADTREVYDVTGAGDTVIATLGAAFFAGVPLLDAARLANAAAGVAVGKLGTATVTLAELRTSVGRSGRTGFGKLLRRDEAAAVAASARAKGRTVVFANGCFDLLHAGHVALLQRASTLGDLLIVGLNSDASIRRLKGATRPLTGEQARAEVMAALACVDHVVIFAEDTPATLVAEIVPDVLVKGADYAGQEVVGREVVEAAGGRVELLPLLAGQSTSGIVANIVDRSAIPERAISGRGA